MKNEMKNTSKQSVKTQGSHASNSSGVMSFLTRKGTLYVSVWGVAWVLFFLVRLPHDGTRTSIKTTGGIERYAWHKQEYFKGRGILHGSVYMGWGFQPYNGLTYTADEANLLSAGQLIATPVFLCIPDAERQHRS